MDGESGTGWLIAPNRVLTAYHVIEADPQQIILRHPDLGFFKAAVIHVDSKKDMALLGFQLDKELGSPVSPLVLGNVSTSDIASPVMILGYGSAGFNANEMGAPRARIGALSQIVDTGTEHGLNLLLDIIVTSGDSGGPVINHLGQVIGMTRALSIGEKFVYAIHEDDISGLVLLSSITNIPIGSGATNLNDLNLDQVSIPTLVIAHKKDSCQGTPPRGATEILESLKKSPNAMVKFFQGGFESGQNPCLPETYHTFNGIQDKVAKLIAEFIKNNIKSDNHSD